MEELERRLRGRNTDGDEAIIRRLAKAGYEMEFADKFDTRVVNDDIDRASAEVKEKIEQFISD